MIKILLAWYYILTKKHLITISQKKEIYKKCINAFKIEENNIYGYSGLCSCLSWNSGKNYNYRHCFGDEDMYKYFPELYVQKPFLKSNSEFWWKKRLTEPRIKALNNALKLLDKYN